jgi:putative tryptophan/tyrosine transport system substrate-binding protein
MPPLTDRRIVVAWVAGIAAPLPARAQPKARLHTVGFLAAGTAVASRAAVETLRDGLRELGWVEGSNLAVEYRYAEGRFEQLPQQAADLVSKNVEIIVALPTAATMAAHKATSRIPIVAVSVADPVALGLAASLARPGGNVTGLTFSVGLEVWGKQLELLREAIPSTRLVAVLVNPGNAGHVLGQGTLSAAARSLNVPLQFVEARSPEAFDEAFATFSRSRVDALIVLGDPMFSAHAARLAELSTKGRLPTMHGTRRNIEAGGLLMYAPDLVHQLRQAAGYVDKILKGSKPADLPFEQPRKFEFIVNLQTARAIGVALPPRLLLRADLVIE